MKKNKMSLVKQVITEYKQVQWPSKKEVTQVTVIVLLITLFVSLMLLIFDFSFITVMDRFQNLVKTIIK